MVVRCLAVFDEISNVAFAEFHVSLQGLIKLIQKQETRVLGNEPLLRQLVQVAGTILLDIEITIKLVMQGKVSILQ